MKRNQAELTERMMKIYEGDGHRIHHFMKVWGFAKTIGTMEGLTEHQLHILETAAIVHDIGIRVSLEKYGEFAGHIHEKEGSSVAEPILRELGYEEHIIARVSYLIEHHHTYEEVNGIDYQILLEADFMANSYEKKMNTEAIIAFGQNVFRTKSGVQLLALQSGIEMSRLMVNQNKA